MAQPETDSKLLPVTLVLGGVRSGKSECAERLIERAGGGVYLATAEAGDAEMARRIAEHRKRRGPAWTTQEEPLALAETLERLNEGERPILVDCLTLWLSNLIAAGRDPAAETDRLCSLLPELDVPVVLVANEVGLGIVPENGLARRFRDEAGRLNQAVAARADRVLFMAAGLAIALK